jgi:hypothetical protein
MTTTELSAQQPSRSEPLIWDIRRRKNISLRDMFALAHEHADGEERQ